MIRLANITFLAIAAIALVSLAVTLQRGPHPRSYVHAQRPVSQTSRCDYLLYNETADSTKWEVWCSKPSRPWDTVVIVRPDP